MPSRRVAGVLLAGGQARRMGGGDKCLKRLGGTTLLAHAIERMRPQVGPMVLNANGDPARFAEFNLPVIEDAVKGYAGPLAGILTGLEWAKAAAPQCPWIVSVPTDAPFLPPDLVACFVDAVDELGDDMACAMSNGRAHPVVGLWPVRLAHELRDALVNQDVRKIDAWTAHYRLAEVEFPADPVDPFMNINTPDDLADAERMLPHL